MNRLLMSESLIPTKLKSNKSRRVLQVLQVSATDKDLLVSPNLMSGNGKKPATSNKKTAVSLKEVRKENTPVVPPVRRSKRKNAAAQEQVQTASKEGTEAKATSNKVSKATKSKVSTRKNKKAVSVDPKQSKMDSFIASSSTTNTIFESSLENVPTSVENGTQLRKSECSAEFAISPSYIYHSDASLQDSKDSEGAVKPNMLTCDKPPEKYWEMLAEERRIALEKTLLENEELYDQIQVLETENGFLRSALTEAEKLANIVRQALE